MSSGDFSRAVDFGSDGPTADACVEGIMVGPLALPAGIMVFLFAGIFGFLGLKSSSFCVSSSELPFPLHCLLIGFDQHVC